MSFAILIRDVAGEKILLDADEIAVLRKDFLTLRNGQHVHFDSTGGLRDRLQGILLERSGQHPEDLTGQSGG